MKRFLKIALAVLLFVGLIWAYVHRDRVFAQFSSLHDERMRRLEESSCAQPYFSAVKSPTRDRLRLRAKIRWDLWRIAMSAKITGPTEKIGLLFYRVDATDRSDTEYIYVFAADGTLLAILWEPMA